MNLPYGKPTAAPLVQVAYGKPKEERKVKTFSIDDDLTRRVQRFADQNAMNFNEAMRLLLRTALSNDPLLVAISQAHHKALYTMRNSLFHSLNHFFDEHKAMNEAALKDSALASAPNLIDTPSSSEEPPKL